MTTMSETPHAGHASEWRESGRDLPAEVTQIISALEAASAMLPDRRRWPRVSYRFRTMLALPSESLRALPPHLLFTRDINEWGVGFVTQNNLPLGHVGR